jgi:hypothetical protein
MNLSGALADTETLEYVAPHDHSMPGKSQARVEIRVLSIDGHSLTVQRYSDEQEGWYSTGDVLTTVGSYIGETPCGGKYRLLCSGGIGDALVEVGAVLI